ncbi:MAG: Ig-like domain repeat protein [Spirochaetales bacterium]|nr:Ig-like domain repeat protein [Spirochaetales bacterium]
MSNQNRLGEGMISVKKWVFILLLTGIVSVGGAFALGNKEVPEAEVETSGTQYISPNGDGIQDAATIEFEVTVYVKSEEGYVPEYGISLADADGKVISQVVEREKSDIGWFMRLFRSFKAFTLKKSISWDGKDTNGNAVRDGTYTATMWVVAASNQRTDLTLDDFVVDSSIPAVTVTKPEPLIFSPNDDGSLDDITIAQTGGTSEDLWEAEIADASGKAVKRYSWSSSSPQTIVWDGLGDRGELAADGFYSYTILATDRAGNSFSYSFEGIELDTTVTPVTIGVDEKFISPNGDGIKDSVTIDIGQEVQADIVEWRLALHDKRGEAVRTYGGASAPPEEIVFDGYNDAGAVVPGGEYLAVYSLKYRNGNNPQVSDSFVVDIADPEISVAIDTRYISPNGDGRKDEVNITFKSNEIVTWTGEITDASGNAVVSTDSSRTTSLIVWRGTTLSGASAGEGDYFLQATFTDRAGNATTIDKEKINLDVTPPKVTFDIDKNYFSPDGDGLKDTIIASFTSNEPVRGLLTIKDSAGRDSGTFGGFGRAYQPIEGTFSYQWNGIAGSGLFVPDGRYTVDNVYEDLAGNRTTLPAKSFTIDTRPANVALRAPKGFSPNGDGVNDVLSVAVDASFYDSVESWKVSFGEAGGGVMQVAEGAGSLPSILEWNGGMQYAADVKAPEGRYTAKLDVVYRKGNAVKAESTPFFVDVTPPAVNLQATADPFAKKNDTSMEGDLYITMQIEDAHEVSNWLLDVLTPDNEILRSFSGTGDLQDQVMWQDERERVTGVPISERVILKVTVEDEVGNRTDFERPVPLDLLVVYRDGKYYLLVPNVIFGAYQHALDSRGPEMYSRNLASIDRVKKIFDKYTAYDLHLEGHALNIYRGDRVKEAEEEKVLVPLTERRAGTVENALIEAGMDPDRIEKSWYGGKFPIVDVHDTEARWKNRRVEFIMVEGDKE